MKKYVPGSTCVGIPHNWIPVEYGVGEICSNCGVRRVKRKDKI